MKMQVAPVLDMPLQQKFLTQLTKDLVEDHGVAMLGHEALDAGYDGKTGPLRA